MALNSWSAAFAGARPPGPRVARPAGRPFPAVALQVSRSRPASGRGTSSPPQLGQTPRIRSAQATQKEHSKLQIRAGPSSVRRRAALLADLAHLQGHRLGLLQGLLEGAQRCGDLVLTAAVRHLALLCAFCRRATASGRPSSPSRRAATVRVGTVRTVQPGAVDRDQIEGVGAVLAVEVAQRSPRRVAGPRLGHRLERGGGARRAAGRRGSPSAVPPRPSRARSSVNARERAPGSSTEFGALRRPEELHLRRRGRAARAGPRPEPGQPARPAVPPSPGGPGSATRLARPAWRRAAPGPRRADPCLRPHRVEYPGEDDRRPHRRREFASAPAAGVESVSATRGGGTGVLRSGGHLEQRCRPASGAGWAGRRAKMTSETLEMARGRAGSMPAGGPRRRLQRPDQVVCGLEPCPRVLGQAAHHDGGQVRVLRPSPARPRASGVGRRADVLHQEVAALGPVKGSAPESIR